MNFQFSPEQQQLTDSAQRLFDKHYDFEARRLLCGSSSGHSAAVWAQLGELGIHALMLPENAGGFSGGTLDLLGVMDSIGKALLLEPLIATQTVAHVLSAALTTPEITKVLEGVATGERVLALAHTELDSRYSFSGIKATLDKTADGHTLTGHKCMVLHAPQANGLLVTALHEGAVSLAWVDLSAGVPSGMQSKSFRTVDNLRAADITFDKVKCTVVSMHDQSSLSLLEQCADFASVLQCAEAVGAMQFACDTTLDYLKTRKQFGAPIGSFQALQHRMVDMTISCEQARSITYLAAANFDSFMQGNISAKERVHFVSAAKIKIADASRHVGQEAIQLHGGMGMTQEMKISHTFKRLTMLGQCFGDADHHLARFVA